MNNFITSTFCFLLTVLLLSACGQPNPNADKTGEDELKALEIHRVIDLEGQSFQDIIYVPIYSDIYIDQINQKSLLAATLSIRNTSYDDSLFISKIDYFHTDGVLVRSYLDNTVRLPPMGTINYVVDRDDDTGGTGANFIIALSSRNKDVQPLVQAIMIGQNGNKAFAFSTDGYSIKRKD